MLGCDFTSAPSRRKPIVLASGHLIQGRVVLAALERFDSLDGWTDRLTLDGSWVGGFDLPFGLPRELVQTLGWPDDWLACMNHYASLSREEIRAAFSAFCRARPIGGKFAHRATDGPAGSSPSMKWVNPPVAYMLHAGVPRLIRVRATLPGLLEGDPDRVALEAYPGLVARSVLRHASYKSDDKARQTPDRLIARRTLINALEGGQVPLLASVRLRVKLTHAQRDVLADDASGDSLDALLCLIQAAWALCQHRAGHAQWGLPPFDPLEGWIVGA
ncbi:MAG: DUF429 domain-containing protein [Hydrogenophaga sp.]